MLVVKKKMCMVGKCVLRGTSFAKIVVMGAQNVPCAGHL